MENDNNKKNTYTVLAKTTKDGVRGNWKELRKKAPRSWGLESFFAFLIINAQSAEFLDNMWVLNEGEWFCSQEYISGQEAGILA